MATSTLTSHRTNTIRDRSFNAASLTTCHGFSIVELMITIGIAGLFAIWAIPAFNQFMVNNRLVNAVNGVSSGINYARSEAISRGIGVSICAGNGSSIAPACSGNNDWSQGYIIYTDSNLNGSLDGADTMLRMQGPFGDYLNVSPGSVSSIVYTNEGFLEDGNGDIELCTDYNDRRLTIANNGSIRLSDTVTGCP